MPLPWVVLELEMLEGLLSALGSLLVSVFFYSQGCWALRVLSWGRYDPVLAGANDQLIALLGFFVTLGWLVALVLWMKP
jgi:hypothetical protein